LNYAAKYADRLLVIPGVEITTSHGHLLVYFPPTHPERVRDLLGILRIQGELGSRDSHTAMAMAGVIAEAERMGGICIAAHIDRAKYGFELFAQGYPTWKKDIVTSSGLYGFELDEPAHLGWYSTEDDSTPAGAERKKLLRERELVSATAARVRLAPVQNSDAHTLKDFDAQHEKRFLTRYKMNDLSFEALRTALIDPEARVRAAATIPKSFPRVLGMHVTGGFLDGEIFHFSDNLNCFIGGRGTGKSTAIQSLSYGLGVSDDFEERDNCPDSIVVYCEDQDGVRYRYERNRGRAPVVRALDRKEITDDVPIDSFRVEFYAQGELSEVAKDPIANPELLQEFLDRHILLDDLRSREMELIDELDQNSAQLIPIQATAAQLPAKERELADIEKKLKVAETGKLKELVAFQAGVAAEKALASTLRDVQKMYSAGVGLSKFKRDFSSLAAGAGSTTGDKASADLLAEAKSIIGEANASLSADEKRINKSLGEFAAKLAEALRRLDVRHREFELQATAKITEFQKQGLTADLGSLNLILRRRTTVTSELARIKAQEPELRQLHNSRVSLLAQLADVRAEIGKRRKEQLTTVNKQLRQTIDDYTINVYYDPAGVTGPFCNVVLRVMNGTYFQDQAARGLCLSTTPSELADIIRRSDLSRLEVLVGATFAPQILQRFGVLQNLHALEVVSKPETPIIKVITKGSPGKQIPANQLSDGQKHTILLTIAMLAESNLPLVIDQPEDDLDNAFIFSSVVKTLRDIKERRQVIVVTHNANLAVLGDSELIFPMKRAGGTGEIHSRGSIDKAETSTAVQNILEGGQLAFKRRKEIYGY
jgi:DNA repair ATPase RecN